MGHCDAWGSRSDRSSGMPIAMEAEVKVYALMLCLSTCAGSEAETAPVNARKAAPSIWDLRS